MYYIIHNMYTIILFTLHWIGALDQRARSRPLPFCDPTSSDKTAMIQPAKPNPTQGATNPGSHLIDSPDTQGQHFLSARSNTGPHTDLQRAPREDCK